MFGSFFIMAAEKIHIDQFLELAKQYPVIDVRSPGEYEHAHMPGAYSMPLFSNEERKVVGTTYKQQSREKAIKIGLDYFGPKMRKMVEEVEALTKESKIILVYCWRGGMRSGAVSWLLDLYGFKVYTLVGGYKKFRNWVLDLFKQSYPFNILGGYTGSGKTELLAELKRKGKTVVDLEALASHKGSAFGNIGLPAQPSQEMFENRLAIELSNISKVSSKGGDIEGAWLEDESQRIGLVNIPHELWKTMRQSPVWFIDIPFEERLKHIAQEYGSLDAEKMILAIERISQKLGNLNAKTAILLLKEGKISESFAILLKYYDKYYLKGLHNREALDTLLHTVSCKSVTPENANILAPKTAQQPQDH